MYMSVLRAECQCGWPERVGGRTDHDHGDVGHHLAEAGVGDVLEEQLEYGLEEDVIAPGKGYPQAIPVDEFLDERERRCRRHLL
jgi:hypothetical protein